MEPHFTEKLDVNHGIKCAGDVEIKGSSIYNILCYILNSCAWLFFLTEIVL